MQRSRADTTPRIFDGAAPAAKRAPPTSAVFRLPGCGGGARSWARRAKSDDAPPLFFDGGTFGGGGSPTFGDGRGAASARMTFGEGRSAAARVTDGSASAGARTGDGVAGRPPAKDCCIGTPKASKAGT